MKTDTEVLEIKNMDNLKKIARNFGGVLTVVDLETNGTNTKISEIVQFAAKKIEPDGKVSELSFLCKPNSGEIPEEASKVHGIYIKDLEDEPYFKDYAQQVMDFLEGTNILSGYNVYHFDKEILVRQLKESGFHNPFKSMVVFDAFSILKEDSPRTLAGALKFYKNKEIENAHDAMGDVNTTLEIIIAQTEKHQCKFSEIYEKLQIKDVGKNDFENFIIFNDKKEPVLNFSKNKGKLLTEIDSGFKNWMLKQDFVPSEVKDYVKTNYPN